MTANAGSAMNNVGMAARTSPAAGSTDKADASRTKGMRRGDAIRELKKRLNFTNFVHIGRVYLVIIVAIAGAIWKLWPRRLGGSRVVVEHSSDTCCNRRHRSVSTSVRRRHPRSDALHPVRQQKAQRAYVRLARRISDLHLDVPIPSASPGASPVHQRPCARSRLRAAPR